jgi:putative DNA primase/helicase
MTIPAAPSGADAQRSNVDWRASLESSGAGFLGDERNILIALRSAPDLMRLLRFNEFALNLEYTRAPPWRIALPGTTWTEADDTELAAWLQKAGLKVRGTASVAGCIAVAAGDFPFHPVREYLKALTWDHERRLQSWLVKYLNAQGDPVYLSAAGRKFLISAVARILQPGCQVDHVLTLEAPQGAGKSSAARALAVCPEWFAGDLPEIHSKDARLQLLGRWIIEIAELKAMRTSELEAQKSFITQTHDTFRPPYGRRTSQFPRQCVFIATTNESEYLRDRTGNRRWWPVKCGAIDTAALARDRDQLWAEAVHAFRAGAAWHLTPDETALATEQQQGRVHVSELELDVQQYLTTVTGNEVTVRNVLMFGLGLDPAKPIYADNARKLGPAVAEALDRCGWQKDARRGQAKRTTYVRRVDKSGQPI